MQSSMWNYQYSKTLYPINLEECKKSARKLQTVKTLLELAADVVVQDSTATVAAVHILPQELCTVLMQKALEGNRDRAVEVLLTKWPLQSLTLKKFAPGIFTNLGLLHNGYQSERVTKQGLRYTSCVVRNFLETLEKKCKTKLKFVDITGYPTAELITDYLATYCMLARIEAWQKMIRKYVEAETVFLQLPMEEAYDKLKRFTANQSLPDDLLTVKLDISITSEQQLNKVCKALTVSGFKDSTLRLIVDKLDVIFLGLPEIASLLKEINPEYLHGLSLNHSLYSSIDFIRLCPLISLFIGLTSLDLSCNTINIFQNDMAADAMAKLFITLKHLVRLDLSHNLLKSKLRQVLMQLDTPLQYLRVVGCGLDATDLTYLSMSHHTAGLTELDISRNGLGSSIGVVLHLLRSIRLRVCVLELEDSEISESHLDSLNITFENMTSLLYLNISGNSFQSEKVLQVAEAIAGLQDLQYIRMSYPLDCYLPDSDEEQEQRKEDFETNFDEVIHREQERLGIAHRVPIIVLSKLVAISANQMAGIDIWD